MNSVHDLYTFQYRVIFVKGTKSARFINLKMSKIAYILRPTSKKTGEAPISVVHRHKGSDYVKASGVSVKPNLIDLETGKIKGGEKGDSLAPEKNARIQALAADLERAARNVRAEGREPVKEAVAAEFERYTDMVETVSAVVIEHRGLFKDDAEKLETEIIELEQLVVTKKKQLEKFRLYAGLEVVPKAKLFITLVEQHIENNKYLSAGWKRTMSHIIKILNEYNPVLRLEDINLKTLNGLQDFQVTKGYRNNSVRSFMGKITGMYKDFADEAGLSTAFLDRFNLVRELKNENIIYLNPEQLNELFNLDLKRTQSEVRDQFLFLCEVGIRHQDISSISEANIHPYKFTNLSGGIENGFELRITMQKVPKPVSIPLSEMALTLFKRNNYSFRDIVNTYFNRILKALSKKAKSMQGDFVITNYIGNKAVTEVSPLYKLISSHAGRKTFINTCMLKGVSQSTVATWVGHKDLDMIHKHYSNKDAQAAAEAYKIS